MEKDQKLQVLQAYYAEAVRKGLVKTKKEFAALCGVNPSTMSAAMNGDERYLTDSLLDKIEIENPPLRREIEQEMVVVIPTGARAGTIADFADAVTQYDCERIVTPIKGADYAIQVTGDSMSPEYPSGSIALLKKINERAFVEWGKTFVLDTDNGPVLRSIRKTESPDVVECVALNPAYQPFSIKMGFIKGWYRVLMVMTLK